MVGSVGLHEVHGQRLGFVLIHYVPEVAPEPVQWSLTRLDTVRFPGLGVG